MGESERNEGNTGNAGNASNEILVTPEALKQRAQEILSLSRSALNEYRKLTQLTAKTKNCFQGKSAEKFRERMGKQLAAGELQMEKMGAYEERLLQIADEYAAAERENQNAAGQN